ncbi:metal-sulfur cluster assembly factor [bacterium]|nr:metal-sulfur cluster assembly factor [bacterium]
METQEKILEKLKLVKDPELDLDIVTLGLVRAIKPDVDGTGAEIIMTLTSPFCPFANELIEDVEKKAGELFDNIEGAVRVEITFDPPWEPSDELRETLGL